MTADAAAYLLEDDLEPPSMGSYRELQPFNWSGVSNLGPAMASSSPLEEERRRVEVTSQLSPLAESSSGRGSAGTVTNMRPLLKI